MVRFNARLVLAAASAFALLPLAGVASAQNAAAEANYKQILPDRPVTMETLLDRINIQDFPPRYFGDLSIGKAHELAECFAEDGVLDGDGMVARGHKEVAKRYERPANAEKPKGYRRG